jgi:hypothetical protein
MGGVVAWLSAVVDGTRARELNQRENLLLLLLKCGSKRWLDPFT